MKPRSPDHHLPQLDALRSFAVFAVMLGHFAPTATESLPLGELGVRLFFVLSGFLITGILLNCRRLIVDGAASAGVLRRFYARRFLRLMPPYYALLATMWIAAIPTVRDSLPWHAAYVSNVYFSRLGTWHGETSHFWSLAVEEQFYLLWPLVVLFQSARRTTIAVALIALVAPTFRMLGLWQGWSDVSMVALPFGSTDSLALGALLAVWSVTNTAARDRLFVFSGWISLVAIAWTALMIAHIEVGRTTRDVCLATLWSFLFVWLVHRAAIGFRGIVGRVLENRLLVYLGRISYGLYLFHGMSPRILRWFWTTAGFRAVYPPNAVVGVAGPMLVTIVLAALSWRFYEYPINRLKRYLPYEPGATPVEATRPATALV
jgi:peptidoglycan/LPS O-acetylase OafA/YrhL